MNEEQYRELISLYPEAAKYYQWMSPDSRRDGYWRRIPKAVKSREARLPSTLKAQIHFAKTAYNSYGKTGLDENGMPIVASVCAKEMKGKKFKDTGQIVQDALKKLKEALVEVGKAI